MSIVIACKPTQNYVVTSNFGWRSAGYHWGIDLGPKTAGHNGDPIFAVQSGIVRFAGSQAGGRGYGNYMVVEHTQYGFCSLYAHLSGFTVSVGQTVGAGQQIAIMGNTGDVRGSIPPDYGCHLHFEIRNVPYSQFQAVSKNANYVKNPAQYLAGGVAPTGSIVNDGSSTTNITPYSYSYEQVTTDDSTLATTGFSMFGRKWRIMVFFESEGQTQEGLDLSDMHITFDVNRSLTLDGATGIVQIFNLNIETENKIIQNCNRVTIEAGYEGRFGLIFDGDVIQVIRGIENGTDYYIRLVTMTCERFVNSGVIDYTIARGQTMRDAIGTICAMSTNSVGVGSISSAVSKSKTYIRGKVVFGKAESYLDQIASSTNTEFYIDNGQVNLTSVSDLTADEVIYLDSKSGLIGTPEQSDGYYVNFTSLINPAITLNSLVKIPNEQIAEYEYSDGNSAIYKLDSESLYRVISINYSGDTRGNNWYLECNACTQAGTVPAIIADITGGASASDSVSGSTYDSNSYSSATGNSNAKEFKSFMYWTSLTSRSSLQYKLQHMPQKVIANSGFCMFNLKINNVNVAAYMVAMGGYYGTTGDVVKIKLTGGKEFYAIFGDYKADRDTDALKQYCIHDGSEIEFIVDKNLLKKNSPKVASTGNCVNAGFTGKIASCQNLGSYTKYI